MHAYIHTIIHACILIVRIHDSLPKYAVYVSGQGVHVCRQLVTFCEQAISTFEIIMYDLLPVQVVKPGQDLPREVAHNRFFKCAKVLNHSWNRAPWSLWTLRKRCEYFFFKRVNMCMCLGMPVWRVSQHASPKFWITVEIEPPDHHHEHWLKKCCEYFFPSGSTCACV